MKKVKAFIADLRKIINEITWPDRPTLIQLTVVVLFISIVTGTLLAVADFIFTKLISWVTFK